MNLHFWGNRLSDVSFGKIDIFSIPEEDEFASEDEPNNFINQIDGKLEQYMSMVQLDVCSRLEVETMDRLRSIVNSKQPGIT